MYLVWTPSSTLQIRRWQGICNLPSSLSSSKGNHLLWPGRCNIRAQHQFLWKTGGWFTCRSLRKSYTTHYAFKPRIIVPKHPSRHLGEFSFIPIKANRILLFAKYFIEQRWPALTDSYLHLSIYEIRSADNRVGSALWSFDSSNDSHFHLSDLMLIKSTENTLGITVAARCGNHWKLFDISTTETDASNNSPLIESGRIDFNLRIESDYGSLGFHSVGEPALMSSPSHTIPWQSHSTKCGCWGTSTQRNVWHSLFGFWSHKQYELFLRYTHVRSHSRVTGSLDLPGTILCIFCRWVQVCYGLGSRRRVCMGYPKQGSSKGINGRL